MIYNHFFCLNNIFKVDFENFLDDLQVFAIESLMTGPSIVFKNS